MPYIPDLIPERQKIIPAYFHKQPAGLKPRSTAIPTTSYKKANNAISKPNRSNGSKPARPATATVSLEQVNYGTLYLTNKRLVFESNNKNSTLPSDRIRNIVQRNEGIELQKDKAPVLKLSTNLVDFSIILNRLLRS